MLLDNIILKAYHMYKNKKLMGFMNTREETFDIKRELMFETS